MVAAGGTLGAFFATVIGFIFVLPSLPTWTWRIPFFLGALIGLVGFYMRHELKESPKFIEEKSTLKKNPTFVLFKHHFKAFLCVVGMGALGTVPFYLVIGGLNTDFVAIGKMTFLTMMSLNMTLTLFCALTLPLVGRLADKMGLVFIMVLSSIILFGYSLLFFHLLQEPSLFAITLAEFLILGLSQGYVAPLNAFAGRLFPVSVRYSGVSFGYCVGMALFGGTAPYISMALTSYFETLLAPAFYLMFVCLLGIGSVLMAERIQNKEASKGNKNTLQ